MRRWNLIAAIFAVVALAGCRTSDGREGEAGQLTLKQIAEERPAQSAFERIEAGQAPGEKTGFGLRGAGTCLPLPEGRQCLAAPPSSLVEACKAVGGEMLVCEDCSQLCSVALVK